MRPPTRTLDNEMREIFLKNFRIILEEKGLLDMTAMALTALANNFFQNKTKPIFTQNNLSNWRSGISLPSYPKLIKLADWLDCEADDLLPSVYHKFLRKS